MKKKDELYDFGTLGKWSFETLKHQTKRRYCGYDEYYDLRVDTIEDVHSKKEKSIWSSIDELYSIKVSGFLNSLTIRELAYNMDRLSDLKKELKKVHDDYEKYRKVMEVLKKDMEDKEKKKKK